MQEDYTQLLNNGRNARQLKRTLHPLLHIMEIEDIVFLSSISILDFMHVPFYLVSVHLQVHPYMYLK